MKILVSGKISKRELENMASDLFGDMVKGVVDVGKESIALDAELHSDLEAALLEKGSSQKDLWGINIYPGLSGEDMVEFDALINIRPSQNNCSRGVEDPGIQEKINEIVHKRVDL